MKKFAILILVLSLLCGVLAGCGNGKGNISDRKDGMVTDSPNDADDILDRDDDNGIMDDDRDDMKDKDNDRENANDGNKDNPVNSTPTQSPDTTQPVTP